MPLLGITGGIASGKTTFRKMLLERLEADFFDTDACARELLAGNDSVRHRVTAEIDSGVYDAAGVPDRERLREVIFRDPVKKRLLEAILHPLVRRQWTEAGAAAAKQGRLFIVEIPLLFETRSEAALDRVITVACSRETQLDRLARQRGMSREISEKIIASQAPLSLKITHSHHVLWNDSHPGALLAQTELFSRYLHDRYG
ncbi:MAG TPA: dephospho-CoA kinase [Terrimicrobiaceae bacterium]|nr:dephospho-CoA kinase [Terrimicrobiaceae bacterium]